MAAPWYEQNYDTLEGWRAEATVGLKGAVLQAGPLVAALQGGAYWNSEPPAGCGEGGGELRALGGWGLGQRAFLNLEAAARLLEGGCEGRRLEFTAGYRPMENWLALGQVFVDAVDEHEETVKAQIALVRFGSRGRGLQLGVRARVDGGAEEAAFVIGWWGPPGG